MLKKYREYFRLLSRYSFLGILILFINFLITKLFFRNAKIIRIPFSIKGKKAILFGKEFIAGPGLKIDCLNPDSSLVFGDNFKAGNNLRIAVYQNVVIGNNVLIASNVFITDHSHGDYTNKTSSSSPLEPPCHRTLLSSPVIIGNNCWIGEGVVILQGTEIKNGCVIGAHSIVSGTIPENSVAVGAPAKVVKKYDFNNKHWVRVR